MIKETILHALREYGPEAQLVKAIEEMGECSAAMARWLNHPTDEHQTHLAEEIADVTIMMMSATRIVGEEKVEDWMDAKIRRLRDRLAVQEAKRRKECKS
jgi:NTP pyrophosphatase (non-canonical NTP hydrolase)